MRWGWVKLADSVILPNSEGPVLCIVIPFRFVLPLRGLSLTRGTPDFLPSTSTSMDAYTEQRP